MKLEAGKFYILRCGRKVGPLEYEANYPTYPFSDPECTMNWTIEGKVDVCPADSGYDIEREDTLQHYGRQGETDTHISDGYFIRFRSGLEIGVHMWFEKGVPLHQSLGMASRLAEALFPHEIVSHKEPLP